MFNFEKLEVYKKALDLTHQVFIITSKWNKIYQYSIGNQLRRASLSIVLNIAEGSSKTKNEYLRFLSISRGSCYECVPLIDLAYKQKLISLKDKENWYNQLLGLAKMLSSFRNALSK